jgi:hypothetical protein
MAQPGQYIWNGQHALWNSDHSKGQGVKLSYQRGPELPHGGQ